MRHSAFSGVPSYPRPFVGLWAVERASLLACQHACVERFRIPNSTFSIWENEQVHSVNNVPQYYATEALQFCGSVALPTAY
jgi:hypothetical protein